MHQSPLLIDPSCYHSSFAAQLRSVDPQADPVRVLGNNAATAVRLDDDGLLAFADPIETLAEAFGRNGFELVSHPVRSEEDWQSAVRMMDGGATIAVVVDYFHLPHYWPGQGRIHALHVVAVHEPDHMEDTVGLLDAGDVVFFDGRLAQSSLRDAMYAQDVGQAWLELRTSPRSPGDGLRAARDELTGHGRWLGGVELVRTLRKQLDHYLELVGGRSKAGQGSQAGWGLGQRLPIGLWWYHHTLRWFARYLGAQADPRHTTTTEAAELAARDVLVVRNLMMRLGAVGATSERARSFRLQLETKLDEAEKGLETVAAELSEVLA